MRAGVVAGLAFVPIALYTLAVLVLPREYPLDTDTAPGSVLGLELAPVLGADPRSAVAVSAVVGFAVLALAVVQACRVAGVRWALVVIGVVCAGYHGFAALVGRQPVVAVACLLLWLVPAVFAATPAVGRARAAG
ncbi:hypothetical protein [Saccharothrix variisporea]|uniref:Uncharacterized protein n=1 Tax=Saccharothrix variisporea TaxID=543527 RepID=A0A495XEN4_9PSEU|nr:hypothetical protein [Saccharothrix variisporea]RKT72477.1 hypothetical protein DFJ66_5791 [Saccharothrix variisporea]